MRFKRQAESYMWCDFHGEIHATDRDPYGMGEDCRESWRKVYVETDDKSEVF